jgi:hypothetical protein
MTQKQKEKIALKEMSRFEKWLTQRVKTIHYANNEKMSEAYIRIYNANIV